MLTTTTGKRTTAAGIYVSSDGVYRLGESFVITDNAIRPARGSFTSLDHTRGNYSVSSNTH